MYVFQTRHSKLPAFQTCSSDSGPKLAPLESLDLPRSLLLPEAALADLEPPTSDSLLGPSQRIKVGLKDRFLGRRKPEVTTPRRCLSFACEHTNR